MLTLLAPGHRPHDRHLSNRMWKRLNRTRGANANAIGNPTLLETTFDQAVETVSLHTAQKQRRTSEEPDLPSLP